MRFTVDPVAPGQKAINWWSQFGLENDQTWKRALIILVLLSLTVPLMAPINHDVAWHLYAAKRMLAGDQLYVDLIEYNPPFIYLFNVAIVAVAQALGTAEQTVFLVFVLSLALLLLYFSSRLLAIVGDDLSRSVKRLLLLTFLCFSIPYVGTEFGQREHLTLLFLLPFVLLLAARVRKRAIPAWMIWTAGFSGAVGMAFKPQFLMVWVLLEAFTWLWKGGPAPWQRQETLAFVLFFGIYGLFVLLFMPEYLSVVRTAAETYPAFDSSIWETVAYGSQFPLVALAAYLIIRSNQKNQVLCQFLALTTLGALLVAVSSQKGWFYHFIPAHAFGALLLALLLVTLVESESRNASQPKPYQAFASMFVLIFLVVMVATEIRENSLKRGLWEYSDEGRLVELIQAEGGDQRLLFFSTSMFPAFPVVNHTESDWTMRFPFLWFIPGLYPDGFDPRVAAQSMSETEETFFRQIVDDFLSHSPSVVVTDDRIRKQGIGEKPFDFIQYFTQDPAFAKGWQHYELVTIAGGYRVFHRVNAPAAATVPDARAKLEDR